MSGLDSKDESLINQSFLEKGFDGVLHTLKGMIDTWKTKTLDIVVTGQSGVGKSSFLNALRDLTADDEGAAAVGVVETTVSIQPYPHPNFPNITFWDVPGVGTTNWPQNTYLKDIEFEKFDFYIILTATRFMKLDTWLAHELQKSGKKCFFVRTKIDSDLENERRAHPKTFNRAITIERIRNDCEKHAKEVGQKYGLTLESTPIFLISSFDILDFDFPALKERLIVDVPVLKMETMLLTLSGQTKKLLEQKKEMLAKRIPKVAILSAIGGAIPVPGVSLAVDMELLKSELAFYRQQFGLDQNSLAHTKLMVNRYSEESKSNSLADKVHKFVEEYIISDNFQMLNYLAVQTTSESAENVLRIGLPVIGCLFSAGLSYGVTCATLRKYLNENAEAGFQLLELISKTVKEHAGLV